MKKIFNKFVFVGFMLTHAATAQAQDALSVGQNGNITIPNKLTVGTTENNPNATLRVAVPDTKNGAGIDIPVKNYSTYSIPMRIGTNKTGHSLLLCNGGGIAFTADTSINGTPGADIIPDMSDVGKGIGLKFRTKNINDPNLLDRMVIKPDGRVGIGVSNPTTGLLTVGSAMNDASRNVRYLNLEKIDTKTLTTQDLISVSASSSIIASEFGAYSDARIKKDQQRSDIRADLAALKQIKITDYRYKDAVQHGTAFKKGVLAQELEQVFPQAVSKHTDYITDIFSMPKQVRLMGTTLVINMEQPHGLQQGDMVRLITPEAQVDTLVEVIDEQTFMVKNWTRATTSVFVYGKKVDDFRSVDFDRLTVLGISAIQQLCKEIEGIEQSVHSLETRVEKLEKMVHAASTKGLQK